MLLGVDVGGTFTDAVLAVGGRLVTAKAPTTPEDQSEGVLAAVQAVLERAGERRPPTSRSSPTARPPRPTPCSRARARGRCSWPPRASRTSSSSARQARADLYRLCVGRPAPLVPPERRVGADERMTPDGVARPRSTTRSRDRGDQGARARVGRRLPPARLPPPRARAAARRGARQGPARTSTSRSATRSSARSASTSAPRPPSSTPPSPPCSPPTCASSRERAQDAGLPEPSVMQSSGGLADTRAGRRPRRADRPLRPRRRRGGRRLGRARGGRAGHAVLRHGRHELRRLRRARRRGARGVGPRGRRAPGRAADARHPHRRRRRRLDRLARRGRRAAGRPEVRRRAARAPPPTATAARSRR